jgi:integral membrane protein
MSELKKFRIINKIEGYSFLILLFLAMPLKYVMGFPVATKIAGMVHGILFLIFIYQLLEARSEEGFGKKETLWYFILSLVPFGSFYTDKLLRTKYALALQKVRA